ncbi:hypothetical protein AWC32_21075 [Mycobacterium xenopi]|uniref:Uncharacterized protein n=2 Tax=Mycobacterium xenopi TaxID=1789 RepID=A0AAD1H542_MYCXE|nr:hypothetical protein I552_7564 [Mycobacterium xenopi 3993]ORX21957.1 hypothetical protein AWC32_21075 [Mycobacterium xenopi]BBU24710.1 hypothetical protein MYXE_45000 [Mycobacterium xenopi]SPX89998.1 Uncharacterised protein [Mycobacterium xenopi]
MLTQRLVWGGGTITSLVMSYLAWAQVENQLARWSFGIIFGLLFVASMVMFPWGQNDDGSARRLANLAVRGNKNATIGVGDGATLSGVIQHAGKGDIIAVTVTAADARQISIDTGRNELSRDTKAITMPDARAAVEQTLNERFGELTDSLIEHINERDATLFNRFADPRFLGPLGVAHRSYAELGSEELRTTLSRLLTDLAEQPAGERWEIFLRQAVEVTRVLTKEHVNSLAVKLIIQLTLAVPYDTDQLITALDTLLSPYYERIATSNWDYQYMSSTGVCQDGQLGAFATEIYQSLYEKYRNSMYPALRTTDLEDKFLSQDGPYNEESERLLLAYAESEDDVVVTDKGTLLSVEGARFRVAPDRVAKVLDAAKVAEGHLTEAEKELRAMVLARTISLDDFKKRIAELGPELAALLDTLQKTGALHFPMQPVGFVLAQHEIHSRAPQLAGLVDEIFDDQS